MRLANRILERYGIEFIDIAIGSLNKPAIVVGNKSTYLSLNSSFFTHYGCGFKVTSSFTNILAHVGATPTLVAKLYFYGGLIVASSFMYFSNDVGSLRYNKLSFQKRLARLILLDDTSIGEREEFVRGDLINLNINLSRFWDEAFIYTLDLLGAKKEGKIIQSTNLLSLKSRVAGSFYVELSLRKNNTETYREIVLKVKPRSKNPPWINFTKNDSNMLVSSDFNITFEIYDDQGLLPPKYQKIEINIPNTYPNIFEVNNKNWFVLIKIKYGLIKNIARYYNGEFIIVIDMVLKDIDLNIYDCTIYLFIKVKYGDFLTLFGNSTIF